MRQTRPASSSNRRHAAFQLDALEQRMVMASAAGSVAIGTTYQTIDAFGAASTAWSASSEFQSASFYNNLVNDLGATGVRSAISPTFESANDNNDPNVFNWAGFKSADLALVMQFNQRMKERGVNRFFATIWTPPWWMKTNQSHVGGGELRVDMRAEFAEYVAAVVISAKRDYGIDLAAISLQNEQFFNQPYESGTADNLQMREIYIAVAKKFKTEGITTKLIANEDVYGFWDWDRWQWWNSPMLESDEIDKSQLIVGAHYVDPRVASRIPAQMNGTGVPVWLTEEGGELADWPGSMNTARIMSDALTRANVSSYYYWLYSEQSGIQFQTLMQDGTPNPKYYAFKHFSKYIRPGMVRVQTSVGENTTVNSSDGGSETGGTRISAFRDPNTGASTIVLVNDLAEASNFSLNLNGTNFGSMRGYQSSASGYWQSIGNYAANGYLSMTLPANSIVTLTTVADKAPVYGNAGVRYEPAQLSDSVTGDPLRLAITNGGKVADILAMINDWNTNVNAASATGWTALHAACARAYANKNLNVAGSPEAQIVLALIARGANVNATTTEGITPLHALAMNQFAEFYIQPGEKSSIANALINAGANVNARDNNGRTPLIWSAMVGNSTGPTWTGPNNWNATLPQTLVSRGADRSLRDWTGKSAYDYATQEYKPNTMTAVYVSGADTVAPYARFSQYIAARNALSIILSEDVTATLTASDVSVINTVTNQAITGWTLTKRFSNGLTFAEVKFASALPTGSYRMTIGAWAFTDPNGLGNAAITTNFALASGGGFIPGDATGDGVVNFSDLLVVGQNYNKSGMGWFQGDVTGDGWVNFDDLLRVSQNYSTGSIVDAAAAAPVATTKRRA